MILSLSFSLHRALKAKMFLSHLRVSPSWCQIQLPAGHLSSLGYLTCVHQLMDTADKLSVVESGSACPAKTYGYFLLFPHTFLNIDLEAASQK